MFPTKNLHEFILIAESIKKMPGRHEELYSKVVRKLHPDRSLSPPQKKVEFNDNKLGKFFSIKSLIFFIKSLNYSGKCLKSSKNVVLKKKK